MTGFVRIARAPARPAPRVAPRQVADVLRTPGRPLGPTLREDFGRRFGHDFSRVRVHADADAGASAVRLRADAYTTGRDIVFARDRFTPHTAAGRRLLAHELAHVVQLGMETAPPGAWRVSAHADAAEVEAERAADAVLAGGSPLLRPGGARLDGLGVLRQVATRVDPFDVLSGPRTVTAAEAKALLDEYEALPDADRDAVVRKHHVVGALDSGLARLLAAADPAELRRRRALVSDIEERVQRFAAEQTAGKTLAELGAAEAAFLKAEAEKRALAAAAEDAKRRGVPPPRTVGPTDIAREHERETRRTSPVVRSATNAWDAITDPAKRAAWDQRAATVITRVVAACRRLAPELGINAANLRWAPREIAEHGSNVFATSGDPITFGMSFVETAEADPDYVVRTVVHEIIGHPEFGERTRSYEARVYAEAVRQEPSLTSTGRAWDTPEELSTFAYIGTETYAALREFPYEQRLWPTHLKAGLATSIDPRRNIDGKIGLLQSKYPPRVAAALLQGLYERFRIDPRISPSALALFEELAEDHFPHVLKGVPRRGPRYSFELATSVGVERAGVRTRLYTSAEANVVARWANTALSAGLRLEVPVEDRDAFVRLGLQAGVEQRLFRSLYGELRGGGIWDLRAGGSSGATVGGGLSYDLGPVQLGLFYDYLKVISGTDPDAHRAFLRLGLRF